MNKALLLLGLVAWVTPSWAQQEIVDQFERRSLTHQGLTLPYRLFVPSGYDPEVSYPLVLALHGAGERGTDNEVHIRLHRLATSWADPVNQAVNPAFVVAPQVPPDRRWSAEVPVSQSDFIDVERTTLAILDSLQSEFSIDPERVYVTGLSMGGHGTWDLVSRLPHRFAAAVPMSGKAYADQAAQILHLPIWAFHGESDTVVPPFSAREMIQEMEDLGREVVYTDCRRSPINARNFDCPGTISLSALEDRIDAHADLIFTSVRNGGHGPWSVWYDHPLLAKWLFSKQRVVPGLVSVTAPLAGAVWSGTAAVTWATEAAESDSVEVWISLGVGSAWELAGSVPALEGRLDLDSSRWPDTGAARVRLVVRNADGRVYGRETGGGFRIDNDGDGTPYLLVDDEPLRFLPTVVADLLELDVVASDPEGGSLAADIFYSVDGGNAWMTTDSRELASSPDRQVVTVDLAALPNSSQARLRFEVSDGTNQASAETVPFAKVTPRALNDYVEHVSGDGTGTIALHFVDPDQLTGHRYRISIDAEDPFAKTYSVRDVDADRSALSDVPLSDGILESPYFDGMRLVVQDLEPGRPDLARSGWIRGASTLDVSISGGSVLIAVLRVDLLETEDEYELSIRDAVADTSTAGFGMSARPVRFVLEAGRDGLPRDFLFRDSNGDGLPGGGDRLYILEPDAEGEPSPAWEFRFSSTVETVPPASGDTFLFVPVPKLGSDDVFEFVAAEGVNSEREALPGTSGLHAWPNPFLDGLTLQFDLATPSDARVEVFDVLGRRIAMLMDSHLDAGPHRIRWDGDTGRLGGLATGLMFFRLTTYGSAPRQSTSTTIAAFRTR